MEFETLMFQVSMEHWLSDRVFYTKAYDPVVHGSVQRMEYDLGFTDILQVG